jgi:hypothetical protein
MVSFFSRNYVTYVTIPTQILVGADLNCIKEGVVSKQFLQNTSEKLSVVNNSKLYIAGKTQASIFNKDSSLKTLSLQKILIIPSSLALHLST